MVDGKIIGLAVGIPAALVVLGGAAYAVTRAAPKQSAIDFMTQPSAGFDFDKYLASRTGGGTRKKRAHRKKTRRGRNAH